MRVIQVYSIRFITARAVDITLYYANQLAQRVSELRINRVSLIHSSIRAGKIGHTPVNIVSQCSIPVHTSSHSSAYHSRVKVTVSWVPARVAAHTLTY